MKWKTHISIARALSKSLNLPRNLWRALSEGSIEPDKYETRTSHHDPDPQVIMKHVWKARLTHLQGNNFLAMKELGRALHYIQDKSVSKGFLGLSHDSREEEISHHPIPEDAIKKGIGIAVSSPHFIKKCIRSVTPEKDPDKIMHQACMYSAAIAKSVIGNKIPPDHLIRDFEYTKRKYRKRTLPAALVTFGIISIGSIAIQNFWCIPLGILAGYIVQKLDTRYHYLKKEMEWFGIK